MLLNYEKEILHATNQEACLTIVAKGLLRPEVVLHMLKLYSNRTSLVFVLNMSDEECEYVERHDLPLLCNVTGLSVNQRSTKYSGGGVFYGSSTVLATDFVNKNVQISKISAIIVMNADKIGHNTSTAFICYLFREHNTLGLIKAFTSAAIGVNDYGVGEVTGLLCLNKILFYPRFHETVKLSLPEINTNQIYLKRTELMDEATLLIEDLIKKIYVDKNKRVTGFDYAQILILKQENRDISAFKRLLSLIFNSDALNIIIYYQAMIEDQKNNPDASTWLFDNTCHTLLEILKSMLVQDITKSKEDPELFIYDTTTLSFRSECSKTEASSSENNSYSSESVDDDSEKGVGEVSNVLSSPKLSSFYLVNPKIKHVVKILKENPSKSTVILCHNRIVKVSIASILSSLSIPCECISIFTHSEFLQSFEQTWEVLIMMNPDLGSIRGIEYMATKMKNPLIFILQYKNTIEEQCFLEEIREEKNAFEEMIDRRAGLPLKLELEKIEMEDDPEERTHKVLVDTREMRSKLPFFLYKAGNEIEAKVMEIGDYLLDNGRCIERKAIEDFLGSLNSGRLYQQMQRLVYAYKKPMLLLEFNDVKPVLGDFDTIENFRNSYIARFCLFLHTFPTLEVIWSNSPIHTVRIIRDAQLKSGAGGKTIASCDPKIVETLMCVPGINSFNIDRVIKEFSNICDLAMSSKERLEKILDSSTASKVYDFFTQKLH